MRVEVEVLGQVEEPYRWVNEQHALGLQLRPGSLEAGVQRATMSRLTFEAGEIGLCPRHLERWVGCGDMEHLILTISDRALKAATDGATDKVELRHEIRLLDERLAALVTAVNAERIAGFPSGPLFLDSVEQALASALVGSYAVKPHSVRKHRGGLAPARVRKIREFVHARIEDELTLQDMAQAVGLSTAHFSQMFRKSTGESPHRFVLRLRIERAKEMLRTAQGRMLDVAIACGFKTQQHFARVFRKFCGASPTEYRQEFFESANENIFEDWTHDVQTTATDSAGEL
jgi:AraC family transcriptional regulator